MSETDRLRAALSGIEDALHAAKIAGDTARINRLEQERIKLRSVLSAHNPAFADTTTQRSQADLVAMNYGFMVQRFSETKARAFVRPAFDVQKPPHVARPKKAVVEEWLKTLYAQRLLLIHTPSSMDCEPLARYVSWSFQQLFNKKIPFTHAAAIGGMELRTRSCHDQQKRGRRARQRDCLQRTVSVSNSA